MIVMNPKPPFFIQKGESIFGSITDINVSDNGLSIDFICKITSGGSSSIAFFVDDGTDTPWFLMTITYS